MARVTNMVLSSAADLLVPEHGCCFTFHRAVRAADWLDQPDRGYHLDLSYLETLIDHLRRTGWDIVTMTEATRRVAQPGSGRYVNFSIDDCYRDTAEFVVPLFRRKQAPVTLYVTTGIPDGTMRLRNAGLETILLSEERIIDEGQCFDLVEPAAKRAAFAALSRKWDGPHGDAAYERLCARYGFDPEALDEQHRISWTMLKAMRDDPCVEIGGHTVSHAPIAALGPDAARAEIVGCRERLEAELGQPVRHFAFPFGRRGDCGERDFGLVRQAGFASAATTRKGLVKPGADPFCLPRNTLNGNHRHLNYAYAHLSGASGAAARMLRRD